MAKRRQRNSEEQKIQNGIKEYLQWTGHFVWITSNVGIPKPDGSRIPTAMPGLADIIGVEKDTGRFIAIEVKNRRGYANANQKEFLAKIKEKGGKAGVARSLEDAKEILAERT